jgi:membrane protein YdbS with pleckstrin-like domain
MYADPSHSDLAWRGYSSWAMLPSFVVCGALSAALLLSRWVFDDVRNFDDEVGSLVVFAVVLAIWLAQLFRWIYRGTTYTYRLTPRALFIDRGFLYNAEPSIDLLRIAKIDWGAHWLGRYSGVGWISIHTDDGGKRTLPGILRPAAFAEEIQAAMHKAKGAAPPGG